MVDVSNKLLADAKEELKKYTAKWGGGLCYGTTWGLDGKMLYDGHGACHSWLTCGYALASGSTKTWNFSQSSELPKSAKDFLFINCHSAKKSKASPEATKAALVWLARESPYAKYFLNADDDESLDDGAIILCGPNGATLTEAMWMAKFLRYGTEGAKALDSWYALYKAGVNPFLAAFVASHASVVKGSSFGYGSVTGHVQIFTGSPDYKKLLAGDGDRYAASTWSMFGSSGSRTDGSNKVAGFCKPVKKSDGWGGTVDGAAADEKDFVQRVLEWQQELEGKAAAKDQGVPAAKKKMPGKKDQFLELDL
jgi:hypothetical protein